MGSKQVVNQQGEVIGEVQDKPSTTTEVSGFFNAANTRTVEKLLVYGAALVGATNGFAQLNLPPSIRNVLMGAAGIVVAALHLSGNAGQK